MRMKLSGVATVLVLSALSGAVMAQVPGIARAIGPVTEVWTRDQRFTEFHKELAGRFSDVPDVNTFMAAEQWVSVMATKSMVRPVILKARVPQGIQVAVGDIVDVKAADNLTVRSYAETSLVTAVACKRASAGFDACAAKYQPGMWSATNQAIEVKRK